MMPDPDPEQRNLIELLEATPDLVSIFDAQLKPVYLNRTGQQMLCGTEECEIRDAELWDLYPSDRHNLITKAVNVAMKDGTWKGETELLSRAGDRIPVSQIIVSHKDSTGRLRFLSTLCRDITEQKQGQQKRVELLRRALTAQSDERRRVARELHDEAGQALTSVLLHLQSLLQESTSSKMRECVSNISKITEATLDNISRLARGLHPSVLDDLGLEAAVRRYLEDYGRLHPVRMKVSIRGMEHRLGMELEFTLFRVLQESLTNIAKHSRATSINVALESDGKHARLIIKDDGCGFDRKGEMQAHSGLGLISMEERVSSLDGTLRISSSVGSGTVIEAEIPLQVSHG